MLARSWLIRARQPDRFFGSQVYRVSNGILWSSARTPDLDSAYSKGLGAQVAYRDLANLPSSSSLMQNT